MKKRNKSTKPVVSLVDRKAIKAVRRQSGMKSAIERAIKRSEKNGIKSYALFTLHSDGTSAIAHGIPGTNPVEEYMTVLGGLERLKIDIIEACKCYNELDMEATDPTPEGGGGKDDDS